MKQYVLMSNEELGELEHFGVRGMKWGVRNEKPKSGGFRKFSRGFNKARGNYYSAKKQAKTAVHNSKPVTAVRNAKNKVRSTVRNSKPVKAVRKAKRKVNNSKPVKTVRKSTVYKKWKKLSPETRKAITSTAVRLAVVTGAKMYIGHKFDKAINRMVSAEKVRRASVIYDEHGNIWRQR